MKGVGLAAFGWLVPGGAYLLMRRYLQFAIFAILVSTTFAAGLALHGGLQGPLPADLQGLDPLTIWIFKAGFLGKLLAGSPYLLASMFGNTHSFLDGRLHEYGTTLLVLAGLFNLLAISNALELRKAEC
jgi:hypothetical protein